MNYQHAGTLYPTAARAMQAFFHDYFTACGSNSTDDALEYMSDIDDTNAETIMAGIEEWEAPDFADEYDIEEGFRLATDELESASDRDTQASDRNLKALHRADVEADDAAMDAYVAQMEAEQQ